MDDDTTTDIDQADEDILTYTVSDEALEAASGSERGGGVVLVTGGGFVTYSPPNGCC